MHCWHTSYLHVTCMLVCFELREIPNILKGNESADPSRQLMLVNEKSTPEICPENIYHENKKSVGNLHMWNKGLVNRCHRNECAGSSSP